MEKICLQDVISFSTRAPLDARLSFWSYFISVSLGLDVWPQIWDKKFSQYGHFYFRTSCKNDIIHIYDKNNHLNTTGVFHKNNVSDCPRKYSCFLTESEIFESKFVETAVNYKDFFSLPPKLSQKLV